MKIVFPTLTESLCLILLLPVITVALLVVLPFLLVVALFCSMYSNLRGFINEVIP